MAAFPLLDANQAAVAPSPSTEWDVTLRAHARCYAAFLEQETDDLLGTRQRPASQAVALQRLAVEQRNLLRAMDYARELHDGAVLLAIAQHLSLPLELRGEFRLLGEQYSSLLAEAERLADGELELMARLGLARAALALSKPEEALREAEAAVALATALDDQLALLRSRFLQAEVQWMQSEKQPAEAGYAEALVLARNLGVAAETCHCLCKLAGCAQGAEDFPRCEALLAEACRLAEEQGLDNHLAAALRIEGNILFEQGRLAEAKGAYARAKQLSTELGNQVGVGVALRGLAGVAFYSKDHAEALRLLERSLAILRDRGDRYGCAMTQNNLANVLGGMGDHLRAAEISRDTVALTVALGDRHGQGLALLNLAGTCLKLDRLDEARRSLREALAACGEVGSRSGQFIAASGIAVVLARSGQFSPATTLFGAIRAHLASMPSSHRESCEDTLVQTERLIAAAVENGELSREELEQRLAIGEMLDDAETARYAERALG